MNPVIADGQLQKNKGQTEGGRNGWRMCDVAHRKEKKMYIITAVYHGERIIRKAYSDFQAFTIINQLYRDGCYDVGMRKEEEYEAVY